LSATIPKNPAIEIANLANVRELLCGSAGKKALRFLAETLPHTDVARTQDADGKRVSS